MYSNSKPLPTFSLNCQDSNFTYLWCQRLFSLVSSIQTNLILHYWNMLHACSWNFLEGRPRHPPAHVNWPHHLNILFLQNCLWSLHKWSCSTRYLWCEITVRLWFLHFQKHTNLWSPGGLFWQYTLLLMSTIGTAIFGGRAQLFCLWLGKRGRNILQRTYTTLSNLALPIGMF